MATTIATIDDFHGVREVELVDLPGLAARPADEGGQCVRRQVAPEGDRQ